MLHNLLIHDCFLPQIYTSTKKGKNSCLFCLLICLNGYHTHTTHLKFLNVQTELKFPPRTSISRCFNDHIFSFNCGTTFNESKPYRRHPRIHEANEMTEPCMKTSLSRLWQHFTWKFPSKGLKVLAFKSPKPRMWLWVLSYETLCQMYPDT